MKRILTSAIILTLIAALFTGCGTPKEITPDTVLATIGDNKIYAYEMTYLLNVGATKEEAMEELLNFKAMQQKAIDNGIVLDDTDRQAIADDKAKMIEQYGSQEALNEVYAQFGLTEAQYNAISEMSYQVSKFNGKVTELGLFTEATDDQAKEFYNTNFLRAKHILFKTTDDSNQPFDDAKKAEVKQKAEDTLAKIKGGAAFEDFMKLSEDPGSSSSPDGYLFLNTSLLGADQTKLNYWSQVGVGIMVAPFEQGTSAIEVGSVSDLVESDYGYHIIKRLDLNEKPELFDGVKEQIKSVVNNDSFQALVKEWRASYKEKIKQKLVDTLPTPTPTPSGAPQGAAGTGEAPATTETPATSAQ